MKSCNYNYKRKKPHFKQVQITNHLPQIPATEQGMNHTSNGHMVQFSHSYHSQHKFCIVGRSTPSLHTVHIALL